MVCIYYVINGACKQSFFKLIKGVRSSPQLIIFNISEKKFIPLLAILLHYCKSFSIFLNSCECFYR